jgi:predicted dehydrogenase
MIGVGFIGTGNVAERHAEALRQSPGARLVAVWSPTTERRRDFAARHGAEVVESAEALCGRSDIDAVFVLAAAEAHVEQACAAMEAGKHVLVEKPVATDAVGFRRLRETAARTGRICMPSHNYVYAPDMQRLRHHAGSGFLGRLHSLWILCHQRQSQALGEIPGIVLNDMMVHSAYQSLFLLGPPRDVSAVASNVYFESGNEDQVGLTLTYADGQIATLWTSWATEDTARDPWTVTVKLLGSNGAGLSTWDAIKNNAEPEPGWDDAAYWDSFLWVQRWFLEECVDRGRAPLSSLEDAADALAILRAARTSIDTGRRVPFEPLSL